MIKEEKMRLILRLFKNSHINLEEAVMLFETEKEFIYTNPLPEFYSGGFTTTSTDIKTF